MEQGKMEQALKDLLKKYNGLRSIEKAKEQEEKRKPNGLMDLWHGGIAAGYQKIIWDLEKMLNDLNNGNYGK